VFAPRTDAGGIDKEKFVRAPAVGDVDRVACRAGQTAYDRAPIAQDGVDERGLADVRAAHDGKGKGGNRFPGICGDGWEQTLDRLD
jgi:hypothetical protein